MAFWRKHIWENRGMVPKGSILASGIFEGESHLSVISTKRAAVKFECLKCGGVINIIGSGSPRIFGCEGLHTRHIY